MFSPRSIGDASHLLAPATHDDEWHVVFFAPWARREEIPLSCMAFEEQRNNINIYIYIYMSMSVRMIAM